jgi:hypothetical protein
VTGSGDRFQDDLKTSSPPRSISCLSPASELNSQRRCENGGKNENVFHNSPQSVVPRKRTRLKLRGSPSAVS